MDGYFTSLESRKAPLESLKERIVEDNTPITSYGIILFYLDFGENNEYKIYYLICQRRDTIEYADFIRGKYTKQNLNTYVQLMTREEQERLKKYSFSELWDDLWVNHDAYFYKECFEKAQTKFLNNKMLVDQLLTLYPSDIQEPSWGFPKGKKNAKENQIQCAMREFKEETKLNIYYHHLVYISPVKETFKGSNNKIYSTVYYIAKADKLLNIEKMKLNEIRKETISDEISNLNWITLEQVKSKFPGWRYKLLTDVENKIKKYLKI